MERLGDSLMQERVEVLTVALWLFPVGLEGPEMTYRFRSFQNLSVYPESAISRLLGRSTHTQSENFVK